MTRRLLAAVLLLALALGAVGTVLTVAFRTEVEPPPFRDPGRLVILAGSFRDKGEVQSFPISQMDFADWRRLTHAFEAMSAVGSGLGFNLEQGASSRRLAGELVNAGYFELLGVRPWLGRFFTPAEDAQPFKAWVLVLSHAVWRDDFGADPGVVGRTLRLNGKGYTVAGVAPPGFRGLSNQADLWVPSMLPPIPDYLEVRRERWLDDGVARLAPGVTLREAQRQLNAATAALARDYPNMDHDMGATVTPLGESLFASLRRPLWQLAAAAFAAFLLAACDAAWLVRNGRGRERGGEAGRGPLAAAALGLAAAAGGLVLAWFVTPPLVAASGVDLPSFVPRTPGVGVVVVVAVLGMLAGVVAFSRSARAGAAAAPAVVPAAAPAAARRPGLPRRLLVAAEVVLALVLIVLAVREAHAWRQLRKTDLGMRSGGLLTFRMDLKGQAYMDNGVVSRLLRDKYLPRIAAVRGVRQAALANPTMPTDGWVGGYMTIDDHASSAPDGTYIAIWHSVSPGYFETLGIPILAGRGFTAADTGGGTPTVVVSKSFADQQWPGKSPLGHRIKQDARGVTKEPWMTVVGVAAEARHLGLQDDALPGPDIYMSIYQFPLRLPLTVNFLVRPRPGLATEALIPALHREMAAISPEIPDYDVATLDDRLATQTRTTRFHVLLLALFAGLATLLAAAGLAGLRRTDG